MSLILWDIKILRRFWVSVNLDVPVAKRWSASVSRFLSYDAASLSPRTAIRLRMRGVAVPLRRTPVV